MEHVGLYYIRNSYIKLSAMQFHILKYHWIEFAIILVNCTRWFHMFEWQDKWKPEMSFGNSCFVTVIYSMLQSDYTSHNICSANYFLHLLLKRNWKMVPIKLHRVTNNKIPCGLYSMSFAVAYFTLLRSWWFFWIPGSFSIRAH